jgi:hypothetical protein
MELTPGGDEGVTQLTMLLIHTINMLTTFAILFKVACLLGVDEKRQMVNILLSIAQRCQF